MTYIIVVSLAILLVQIIETAKMQRKYKPFRCMGGMDDVQKAV